MFGIGPTELVIIGLLALIVFGPKRLTGVARDFGRFVSGAQNTVEEFKSELLTEDVKEARRTTEELKGEVISARRFVDEEFKGKLISGEDQNELAATDTYPEDQNKVREWEERKEPSPKKRGSPSS